MIAGAIPSFAAEPRQEQWISVANALIAGKAESYEFNWGEGVQMVGIMQTHERTGNPRYADFVERWAAHHVPKGVDELIARIHPKRSGYCGHWVAGTALVYLYEARKNPGPLAIASGIARFIRAGATRSPEGLPGHWSGNYQMWVDTLYMTCPLLSKLSKLESKPEYLDDAASQLLSSAKHMRDERTGLFYHMWDWEHDRRSDAQWGRGNGWVIMSIADTFEYLPKSHPSFKPLKELANEYARALVTHLDRDGVVHTVMTDLDSYAECSATTMLVYGLLKLVRLGVLPARYRDTALRSWAAVNARFVKDGIVTGVSAGTGPAAKERYGQIAVGTQTWGTGSYLMAGAEVDRLRAGGR
jgi:unsaturated rhamnogalacturonyl hydrolase